MHWGIPWEHPLGTRGIPGGPLFTRFSLLLLLAGGRKRLPAEEAATGGTARCAGPEAGAVHAPLPPCPGAEEGVLLRNALSCVFLRV